MATVPRLWRVCVPLALLIALCATVPAAAYRFKGRPWPTHTITYFNAARPNARAVSNAVYAWNTSGAGIRFVATDRAHAKLIIENVNASRVGGLETLGVGAVGWAPPSALYPDPAGGAPVRGPHIWLVPPSQAGFQSAFDLAETVSHELGHVIGLGHEVRGCATMNPVQGELCRPPHRWQEHCRVLERDDILGAIALYGGHLRTLGPEFCDVAAKPSAPTGLTAVLDPAARNAVRLSWTNPSGLTVGSRFTIGQLKGRPTVEDYFVNGSPGACPPPGHDLVLDSQPTSAGAHVGAIVSTPAPGRWCFTVSASDAFDRFGSPAHVLVDIPAP